MKKNMLKNRSITQPKLLSAASNSPSSRDAIMRQSASPSLRPEVSGILPKTIYKHKVNKSQFMTVNALPNDFDLKIGDDPKKGPKHVIPTAVNEINDEPNTKIVKSPEAGHILKSRSKSTHMSASLADLSKTG